MTAVTVKPIIHKIIAKTPRIHMRNAYQLSYIGERCNDTITITNERNNRVANINDVIALMLLEVRKNDELELTIYADNEVINNQNYASTQHTLEALERVLLTP